MRLRQRGADMRGHVVGAFRIMRVMRAFRRQSGKDGFEIAEHGRIGVFLDNERGRGVPAKSREQPLPHARVPREIGADAP